MLIGLCNSPIKNGSYRKGDNADNETSGPDHGFPFLLLRHVYPLSSGPKPFRKEAGH